MAEKKLTPKQERFCLEYIVDLNGAQAAIRAGYSEATAKEIASENLTKPNVQRRVQELMSERGERTRITADRVIQEIERLAMFDPKDLVYLANPQQIAELPEDVRRSIVGWKYDKDGVLEIKLAKEKALEMLGRHHRLFTDKVETKVDGELEVKVSKVDLTERIKQLKGE
jgi:phage terminase small subunit